MKIKIVKCSSDLYWYSGLIPIGPREVIGESKGLYLVCDDFHGDKKVKKKDCEVISFADHSFHPIEVRSVSPSYQGYFINGYNVDGGELAEVKAKNGAIIRGKIVVRTENAYLKGISIRHIVDGEESVMNIAGRLARLV